MPSAFGGTNFTGGIRCQQILSAETDPNIFHPISTRRLLTGSEASQFDSASSCRCLQITCKCRRSPAKRKVADEVGFCPFCGFFPANICAAKNFRYRSSQDSLLWVALICEIPLGADICRKLSTRCRVAYFCSKKSVSTASDLLVPVPSKYAPVELCSVLIQPRNRSGAVIR
jgi:hypothetical protein